MRPHVRAHVAPPKGDKGQSLRATQTRQLVAGVFFTTPFTAPEAMAFVVLACRFKRRPGDRDADIQGPIHRIGECHCFTEPHELFPLFAPLVTGRTRALLPYL